MRVGAWSLRRVALGCAREAFRNRGTTILMRVLAAVAMLAGLLAGGTPMRTVTGKLAKVGD